MGTDRLRAARVAILGLGLMGGSLALARRWEIVTQASADPAEILPQAEVVILAAPVGAILQLLKELPSLHPGRAIVIDLGSTKSQIAQAMAQLPSRFDPIGGHPMCGKETNSLANAEATLFQGETFAFTPLEQTTAAARELAAELALAVGARPLFLDPQAHDRWVAATSHLPYLLASALATATPAEASRLVGPGFRSASRIAATSPQVMLDVLATNRENILEALGGFRRALDALEESLAGGDLLALGEALARGAARRAELVGEHSQGGGG